MRGDDYVVQRRRVPRDTHLESAYGVARRRGAAAGEDLPDRLSRPWHAAPYPLSRSAAPVRLRGGPECGYRRALRGAGARSPPSSGRRAGPAQGRRDRHGLLIRTAVSFASFLLTASVRSTWLQLYF